MKNKEINLWLTTLYAKLKKAEKVTILLLKSLLTSYYLVPVHGQYNKYWIRAVYKKGERFDFIDGPKYYKLVVNMNDFGIESGGDLNGWQLAGKIKTQMKEAS